MRRGACALAAILPLVAAAQPPRERFDVPFPGREPPYAWPNERGQSIECDASPFQLIDLGTIGPVRIYAGDGCSVPTSDPLSEGYKKVFRRACDLHDICYLGPGNGKGFCDDMFRWQMGRECDRLPDKAAALQCRLTADAWHLGLQTPISTTYYTRSQEWGRRHCRIGPPEPPR